MDSEIRGLQISINSETLVVAKTIPRGDTAAADFQKHVTEGLEAHQAAIVLFCNTDDTTERNAWILISWIPDDCKVRDKMLYSSSREDLKRGLGSSFFRGEYAANESAELSFDVMKSYFARDKNDLFLTERERLLVEEKGRIDAETVFTKTNMMAVLPFKVDTDVVEKLQAIQATADFNWIEISFESETLKFVSAEQVGSDVTSWAPFVKAEEPRFFVFCLPKISGSGSGSEMVNFMAFFCPETAPVRVKMTMSSSKATLVATAATHGLKFNKTFEIQAADEIDDYVRPELDDTSTTMTASSAAASVEMSKPSRPGRGKPRTVSKFSADA